MSLLAAGVLSGCLPGAREQRDAIGAVRDRTLALPAQGDSLDAILRLAPADAHLDVAMATSPTLALVEETAVRRNPNLKVALERWVAYLERPTQRLAPVYPTLGFRYAPMFSMREYGTVVGIPYPGKLVADARAALAEAEAAGGDYRAAENTLRAQAASAYAALYFTRRQLEIVDENLELLARFIDIAHTKYKAGTATLPDVLRVETERENLLASREVFAKEIEVAASSLNILLDRTPETPIGRLAPLAEPEGLDEHLSLFERALARRPELDAARARVSASRVRVSRSEQEWIPDLALGLAYAQNYATDRNFVDLTAGVTMPWFFGPAVSARVREAEADLRGAEDSARATRNTVLDEVKASLARVEAESARYRRLTREVIPRVRKNIDASEAAYVAGQIDFLTLIDTQRTLLAALLDKEASLAELTRRHADLVRAVGGSLGN